MTSAEEFRLMYINHGLRESHRRFHEYLTTSDKQNSISMVTALSELLMWICISDEWHKKNNNKDNYYETIKSRKFGGQYVKGIRYAFNLTKHDMSFIKLIGTVGKKEVFIKGYFTEDYTTELIWLKVDPMVESDVKFENQRKNYQRYIEGESVVKTVNEACSFLVNEYTSVKFTSYENRNV